MDDQGIKLVGKEHLQQLIASLKIYYEIDVDYTGKKCCGITLDWDYINCTVDTSMLTFVPTKLKKFNDLHPLKPQHSPYPTAQKLCNFQPPVAEDLFPSLNKEQTTWKQKIIESFLHYDRAIDLTIIKTLNTFATQ